MDKIQDAQALPAPTAAELDRTPDGVILDTGHWIYFLDAKGMPLIQELNPEENPLNHVRHECRTF